MSNANFTPPPGPPPGQNRKRQQEFEPPLASPSPKRGRESRDAEPPMYTESLAPPPSFSSAFPQSDRSPTANASYKDAERAHGWCDHNPLWQPRRLDERSFRRMREGDNKLTLPPDNGDITAYYPSPGLTYIRSSSGLGDTILLSKLPVYAALHDAPFITRMPRTVYFEVHVMWIGDRYAEGKPPSAEVNSGIAIGFVAPPYPSWRLPGWHRGSLAVHGDDGRRYVNNSYGGFRFAPPFKKDDVVGIGMEFGPPLPYHGSPSALPCTVFYTINGERMLEWDLHEARDVRSSEGDVTGLEGHYDLLAAVGIFGSVEFELAFRRDDWRYKP